MLNTTQSYFKKLYIVLSDRCEYSDDAPENPWISMLLVPLRLKGLSEHSASFVSNTKLCGVADTLNRCAIQRDLENRVSDRLDTTLSNLI